MLQTQAVDCLDACMVAQYLQPSSLYGRVYENTDENLPLRRYLVHAHARRLSRAEDCFAENAAWPREFLVDIGKELVARPNIMNETVFAEIDMCDFHKQRGGSPLQQGTQMMRAPRAPPRLPIKRPMPRSGPRSREERLQHHSRAETFISTN